MAGRRVAKSLVDWAAFAERVPSEQMEFFRAFKSKSDVFVSRVHKFPESIQSIDFEHYKSKIPNKALVVEFEKAYKSLNIPYPKDKDNLKGAVVEQGKLALEESKKTIEEAHKVIKSNKAVLERMDSVPKSDEMTHDMAAYYFPERCLNPWEKPTFWPHTKSYQPENDPETIH